MEKEYILAELKRTAAANRGQPLGFARFSRATGIRKSDWFPHFWLRWGDAQAEAGFARRSFGKTFADAFLVERYVALVRELGCLPIYGDLVRKRRSDPEFPNPHAFGSKAELVRKVLEHAAGRPGYEDVVAICSAYYHPKKAVAPVGTAPDPAIGVIYLYKCRWGRGWVYKIGRSNAPGRRDYEFKIQLPEPGEMIHEIRTDDPRGIETYWQQRFAAKWKNGEWFDLDATDIAAFKRRTFM